MFVTVPEFEQSAMSAIAADGRHYWGAVLAEFPVLPWYLFVHRAQVLDAHVNQVLAVAWEENLADFVESVPVRSRGGIYRVDTTPSKRLRFRTVSALWRASAQGNSEGHLALLALDGSSDPVDSSLRPVAPEHVGRLVYTAPVSRRKVND